MVVDTLVVSSIELRLLENTNNYTALVGDPLKLTDYAKKRINGFPVMIFDNLDDFD